tara:strand:- start:864 stop:1274 length:411 start_codon:yes stop_codon:yes gene_type:complete
MSWMAIKIVLKKSWSFIKNYWHFPVVLIAVLITFLVTRKSSKRLSEILRLSTDNHKKELDIINSLHEEEIKRRDELLKRHAETLAMLEREYQLKFDNLDKKKEEEINKIIDEFDGDPESLAKEMSRKFGVTYVPRN